jgi:hypothetical protein
MEIFVPKYGPIATTIDSPAPSVMLPLAGETLTPAPDADHVVEPVMAEPVLVMVNSTCPVLVLQAPLTVTLDLSQVEAGVFVTVGVGVFVGAKVFVAVGVFVEVEVLATLANGGTVGVGVFVEVKTLAAPATGGLVGVGVLVGIEASVGGTFVGAAAVGGTSVGVAAGGSVGGGATTGGSVGGGATTGGSVGGGATTGGSVGGGATTGGSVASAPAAPDRDCPGAHEAMRRDSMTVREMNFKKLKCVFVFIQPLLFFLFLAIMPKKQHNNDDSCKYE